jgi:hypothetical protein
VSRRPAVQSCCYLGAAEDQRDPGVGQGRPTRAGLCDCLRQHPDVHLQYWPEIQVPARPPTILFTNFCGGIETLVLFYQRKKKASHIIFQ